jgi:hypothetical protein
MSPVWLMALVLLIALALPGILLGLLVSPLFYFLMLLMALTPLLFLRPAGKR